MADQTKPPRWAVKLEGHELDLADARDLFAVDPRFRVTEIAGPDGKPVTVLLAEELEQETSSDAVFTRAARLVDLLNGAMLVEKPDREPLFVEGTVLESTGDGGWRRHLFEAITLAVRSRTAINPTVTDSMGQPRPQPPPAPSPAQLWAVAATTDDTVADVLSYLRGQPDWFDLYKAFEAVRDDVSAHIVKTDGVSIEQVKNTCWRGAPWVERVPGGNKNEAHNFYRNCNWHRHHDPKPPPRMLTIEEARVQLAALVKLWLAWRK